MSTSFDEALRDVLAFTPEAFAAFGNHVKPEWFLEALAAHGNPDAQAEMRRRKLPLDRALWLVIGMGLFRDRSIHEVVEHLELVIPRPGPRGGVAPSAVPQARSRLGIEPVQYLFDVTAREWARPAAADRWRGLSLWGIDGSCFRIPDSTENSTAFGRPDGGNGRGAGYPQLRMVALFALRSHTLAKFAVGGYRDGELTIVQTLWDSVPEHSLTIIDRGLLSWGPLYRLSKAGTRHWLMRAKSHLKWRHVQQLGKGDELVEIEVKGDVRKRYPDVPRTFQARVLSYEVKGYRPQKLITSMTSAIEFPAREVAQLYHQRWEVEIAYDEIKTHMLEREEALRSRTPNGVHQELAGIAIAYNLVRVEMARVAAELGLPATRLSFRHALMLVRNFCLAAWAASPGVVPRRLATLGQEIRLLVLPERRHRHYARQVKIKMSNYSRNRGKSARAA